MTKRVQFRLNLAEAAICLSAIDIALTYMPMDQKLLAAEQAKELRDRLTDFAKLHIRKP